MIGMPVIPERGLACIGIDRHAAHRIAHNIVRRGRSVMVVMAMMPVVVMVVLTIHAILLYPMRHWTSL
jgi:hypothetical protein